MPADSSAVPQDVALAEQGVLGSVFEYPEDLGIIAELLQPEDFAEPRNGVIYETMLAIHEAGESPNPVVVASRLSRAGNLGRVGGIAYLQLLTSSDTLYAVEADSLGYALIVQEASHKRKIAQIGQSILESASYSSGHDAEEVQAIAEAAIQKSAELFTSTAATQKASELFESVFNDILDDTVTTGIPSGFSDLDQLTSGWQPGQFIIIAARPAVGKSTIATDFLRAAAIKAGIPAALFSLEMDRNEIMRRLLSAEAKVELQKIRTKTLDQDDIDAIRAVQPLIEAAPVYLNDSPGLTPAILRAQCQKLKARGQLGVVFLDYLQLMESGRNVESRQQEVSEFSRAMKLIAKELEVPVIALSQLNRGSEQRADKRPQMSDLRESGSLEQDADVIILLDRPEQRDPTDRPGQADLILAKQRNGPTGTIPIIPLLHLAKFASGAGLARMADEPPAQDEENAPPPEAFDDSPVEDFGQDHISEPFAEEERVPLPGNRRD